jgi:multidrug efflux pump subunit AcrA (membrane-fusion protein)
VQQREAELAEIRAQIDSERRRNAYDRESVQHEEALLQLTEQALERSRDLLARNLGSRAALDEARRAHEQQQLALNTRRLSLEDFDARLDQLEARARRAEAVLEDARLDRARTRISAPFAGRIARLPVAPGDRVRVGDTVLELYDDQALEVRAAIPATYLPRVRAALSAGNDLTARGEIDGLHVDLRLSRLAAQASTTGAGVEGLFEVTAGGEELPLGRFLTLRLSLPARDRVVTLPFEALYGTDRIYRLEEGRMRALTVERHGEWQAPDGSTRILVHSPQLRAGDRIVTTRLPNALDGLRVSAVDD